MQNVSPGKSWSDQFKVSSNGLNSTAVAWKDLMNEILLESDIFKEKDIKNLKFGNEMSDPNVIMNLRHELVREASAMNHVKTFAIPKEDIMTEARKLIRKENLERLAKEKEERIVNKELEQLKQSLENERMLQKMALDPRPPEKKTNGSTVNKVPRKNNKVWKKLESYDACWEIDSWFTGGCGPQSTNINLQEKGKHDNRGITNFRITVKKKEVVDEEKEKESDDNSLELASIKGDSEISFKTQIALTKDENEDWSPRYWDDGYSNGKNEIMQRFFQGASEIDRVKQVYKTRAVIENSKPKNLSDVKLQNRAEAETRSEKEILEKSKKCNSAKLSPMFSDDDLSRFQTQEAQTKIKRIKDYVDLWNLKYYWKIWRRFVLERKSQKEKMNRERKIETFLQRLLENKSDYQEIEIQCEKKKRSKNAKSSTLPKSKAAGKERLKTAPLENKFKEQQKKIEERKKEIIKKDANDFKLEKIEREVKKSSEETYDNLTKNMSKYHPSLRGRMKVLKTLTNLNKNKVEKIDAEMQKVFPIPEVFMRMQRRDEERKRRWEEIRDRKRKIQEEKERQQKEKEEETRLLEENEKKRKIEELKEKRRLQKEAEEEAKREREKMKKQLKLADEHYKTVLLRKYGMDPWKCLIRFRSLQEIQAEEYYERKILSCHFLAWKDYVQDRSLIKQTKADLFYRKILLRNCLQTWIDKCNEKIKQYQAAVDWADMKLTERALKCWMEFVQVEQLEHMDKLREAEDFHARRLKEKCLKKMICFPELMRLERDKEDRKRVWRQKVQEVLPDFRPVRISESI